MAGLPPQEGGVPLTLDIDGVSQGYGSLSVLDSVSFSVDRGEVVSVLGPNGSGKSTLIRTACNILKPRAGAVRVDGAPVGALGPKEFSRLIGYVPQKYIPSDYMTVFDAVLIGRAPYMSWSYSDDDFDHAERAMERMGVFDLAEKHVNDLSGGQIQKVVLARALAQDPEYYVLDEPTSALDLKNQMLALRTVRDTVSDGSSGALVALHDLNLAMHYSDKVVMLKNGRVCACGRPEEVVTEDSIREVYGVESEILEGRSGRFVHIIEGRHRDLAHSPRDMP